MRNWMLILRPAQPQKTIYPFLCQKKLRAITTQELKSHTWTDPTLLVLSELITSNKWREIDKIIESYENIDVKELNIYNSQKNKSAK